MITLYKFKSQNLMEANFTVTNTGLFPVLYVVVYDIQYFTVYPSTGELLPNESQKIYISASSSENSLPSISVENNNPLYSECYSSFLIDNEIIEGDCKYEHMDFSVSKCHAGQYNIDFVYKEPKYCLYGESLPKTQKIDCCKS